MLPPVTPTDGWETLPADMLAARVAARAGYTAQARTDHTPPNARVNAVSVHVRLIDAAGRTAATARFAVPDSELSVAENADDVLRRALDKAADAALMTARGRQENP